MTNSINKYITSKSIDTESAGSIVYDLLSDNQNYILYENDSYDISPNYVCSSINHYHQRYIKGLEYGIRLKICRNN